MDFTIGYSSQRLGDCNMISRLLILGLNIIILATLLGAYGLIVGDNGLIGVSASMGLVGGVLVIYSSAPVEASTSSLMSYTGTLVNAVTSTLEDLDLLDSNICSIRKRDMYLLVFSKVPCPLRVDPGIGFTGGSPYLAIPIEPLPIETPGSSSELSDKAIEDQLRSILVDELSICKSVRVESESGLYRVQISGLNEQLREYVEYPVDPYTIITLSTITQITPMNCTRLINRVNIPDGILLVTRVEEVTE